MQQASGFRQGLASGSSMLGRGAVVALVIAVSAASGCMHVHARFGPAVNFTSLGRTFGWLRTGPAGQPEGWSASPYLNELLGQTITNQFVAKGYVPTSGAPDFWVTYHLVAADKAGIVPNTAMGLNREGSLVIGVIDPPTRRLIWYGYAKARLNRPASPAEKKERVIAAVDQVLARFPSQGETEYQLRELNEDYARELADDRAEQECAAEKRGDVPPPAQWTPLPPEAAPGTPAEGGIYVPPQPAAPAEGVYAPAPPPPAQGDSDGQRQ